MADGRLNEDGASQSITDAISTLYNRATGSTQNTVRAIGGFLTTAQEQVTSLVQSDVAREMATKVSDGLGNARERLLEMDRAGRERFAEYFPQSRPALPVKSAGEEIPTIESTPGETLKYMAQAAIPKIQNAADFALPRVQQATEFLAQGASELAGNLQASWRELAAQAITPETLKPQMEQVPVTIRVDGANAFQGTLIGGQLLGLDQKQNAMIQQALTNPQSVEGSVKMLVGNQPQLVLSQQQVLTDNFELTGPQRQQSAELNTSASQTQKPAAAAHTSQERLITEADIERAVSAGKVPLAMTMGHYLETYQQMESDQARVDAGLDYLQPRVDEAKQTLQKIQPRMVEQMEQAGIEPRVTSAESSQIGTAAPNAEQSVSVRPEAKQAVQATAAESVAEAQPVKMPENWQEALFAKVSAISTGMDQIHQKISQLESQLGEHSTEFGYIANEHNALGQKIDRLADQLQGRGSTLKPAKPTVRQWLNTTRTTIKTAVVAKLQQFKQFVVEKYQQHLGGKVEQATDFVKDKAQVVGDNARAVEAKVKAIPYEGTKAFMSKAGEPAIRFMLSKGVQPDQAGNRTLNTNDYQYSMDAKGTVTMKAKDGRGTLKPSTMTKKDLNAVGAIAKHFKAHQERQRQQQFQSTVQPKTALKR